MPHELIIISWLTAIMRVVVKVNREQIHKKKTPNKTRKFRITSKLSQKMCFAYSLSFLTSQVKKKLSSTLRTSSNDFLV